MDVVVVYNKKSLCNQQCHHDIDVKDISILHSLILGSLEYGKQAI
jgi:hypothetical protein